MQHAAQHKALPHWHNRMPSVWKQAAHPGLLALHKVSPGPDTALPRVLPLVVMLPHGFQLHPLLCFVFFTALSFILQLHGFGTSQSKMQAYHKLRWMENNLDGQ